jgi:hypothetical protein
MCPVQCVTYVSGRSPDHFPVVFAGETKTFNKTLGADPLRFWFTAAGFCVGVRLP